MRGIALITGAILLALSICPVTAQEKALSVGVFYGGSEPWWKAGDNYDHNYYLGGIRITYPKVIALPKGRLDLGLEVAYLPWKMKGGREDYKSTVIASSLSARYCYPIPPREQINLSALLGCGLYPISYSVPAGEKKPGSQTSPGVCFGAGVGYKATEQVRVDLTLAHHIAFTDYVGAVGGKEIKGKTPFTMLTLGVSYTFPIK